MNIVFIKVRFVFKKKIILFKKINIKAKQNLSCKRLTYVEITIKYPNFFNFM